MRSRGRRDYSQPDSPLRSTAKPAVYSFRSPPAALTKRASAVFCARRPDGLTSTRWSARSLNRRFSSTSTVQTLPCLRYISSLNGAFSGACTMRKPFSVGSPTEARFSLPSSFAISFRHRHAEMSYQQPLLRLRPRPNGSDRLTRQRRRRLAGYC